MENMRLIDLLLSVVSAMLGWGGKVIWDAIKELRRDLRVIETELPREYVRKSDWDRATDRVLAELREMKTDIGERMDAIWTKLDGKVDRK